MQEHLYCSAEASVKQVYKADQHCTKRSGICSDSQRPVVKVYLFEPENLESNNLETQALALSSTARCCSSDGLDRDSCPLSSAPSLQPRHTLYIAGFLFSALCMPE